MAYVLVSWWAQHIKFDSEAGLFYFLIFFFVGLSLPIVKRQSLLVCDFHISGYEDDFVTTMDNPSHECYKQGISYRTNSGFENQNSPILVRVAQLKILFSVLRANRFLEIQKKKIIGTQLQKK